MKSARGAAASVDASSAFSSIARAGVFAALSCRAVCHAMASAWPVWLANSTRTGASPLPADNAAESRAASALRLRSRR